MLSLHASRQTWSSSTAVALLGKVELLLPLWSVHCTMPLPAAWEAPTLMAPVMRQVRADPSLGTASQPHQRMCAPPPRRP